VANRERRGAHTCVGARCVKKEHVDPAGGQGMNLKPLGDRVVVKPSEAETQTQSGLFIPDTAKEKPQKGTVVAAGEGRWEDGKRIPLDVKPGDVVIYSKYGGTEIKVEGTDHLILSERDILAIVEG
jgi:chaperonin GroES